MSNYYSNFDFLEIQISNNKERYNEDKLNF